MAVEKLLYQRISAQQIQSPSGAVRVQQWTAPLAASATRILAATALTAAVQTILTGITNPVHPRNVTITGNASGITGNVVITGTSMRGNVITETIALSGTSTVAGNSAFATITNIQLPIQTHGGTDTVSVGTGTKLGLDRRLPAAMVFIATVDGAPDSALPTVAYSSVNVHSNTAIFATAPNGTHNYLVAFVSTEVTEASGTTA